MNPVTMFLSLAGRRPPSHALLAEIAGWYKPI